MPDSADVDEVETCVRRVGEVPGGSGGLVTSKSVGVVEMSKYPAGEKPLYKDIVRHM